MYKKSIKVIAIQCTLIVLLAMTVVPAMASETSVERSDYTLLNSTLNCTTVYTDLSKYDKPMTKEQFFKANAEYYEFLSKSVGKDIAKSMIDDEYLKVSKSYEAKKKKDALAKSSGFSLLSSSPGDSQVSVLLGQNSNVYFWPYVHSEQVTDSTYAGPVSLFFSGVSWYDLSNQFCYTGVFHAGAGTPMNGLRGGSSSSMSWGTVGAAVQLENGDYWGERYHFVLIPGHSDSNKYTYGDCHKETWSYTIPGTNTWKPSHYGEYNSYEMGQDFVKQTVADHPGNFNFNGRQDVYLGNTYAVDKYSDGWATQYW